MIWKGKTKFSSLFFVTQENDSYREYCLPFGWKKTGYLRQNGKTWDFFVFSPNGKKFRSTVEVNRYLDQNFITTVFSTNFYETDITWMLS